MSKNKRGFQCNECKKGRLICQNPWDSPGDKVFYCSNCGHYCSQEAIDQMWEKDRSVANAKYQANSEISKKEEEKKIETSLETDPLIRFFKQHDTFRAVVCYGCIAILLPSIILSIYAAYLLFTGEPPKTTADFILIFGSIPVAFFTYNLTTWLDKNNLAT